MAKVKPHAAMLPDIFRHFCCSSGSGVAVGTGVGAGVGVSVGAAAGFVKAVCVCAGGAETETGSAPGAAEHASKINRMKSNSTTGIALMEIFFITNILLSLFIQFYMNATKITI
jgi:hypothetical protein